MGAGCDNSNQDSIIPSPTPVPLTTVTFMGTVDPGGLASHVFTVAQQGEVDITLIAAGPPATISMGLGIGTPIGTPGNPNIPGGTGPANAATTPPPVGTAKAGDFFVACRTGTGGAVSYTVTVAIRKQLLLRRIEDVSRQAWTLFSHRQPPFSHTFATFPVNQSQEGKYHETFCWSSWPQLIAEKGQVIAPLDSSLLNAVQQARASWNQARVSLENPELANTASFHDEHAASGAVRGRLPWGV